jgi:GNAT superfamily N-acetyltransferase
MEPGERAELEALRDWVAAAPAGVVMSAEHAGALAVRSSAFPARELNRVLGVYDVAALDAVAPFYASGSFWIALDPEAGLDEELLARGFVADYPWQKFARGLEPVDARTDLKVRDAETPGDFAETFAEGYDLPAAAADLAAAVVGRPGWHCCVAYDERRPVATGALFESGEAGWLGAAATVPSHRGRGAQSAILAARVERARERGLRVLVTETGVPRDGRPGASYRNLVRSGFEPTYVRPNYASPG